MTTEEKRIKIAEACGWKVEDATNWFGLKLGDLPGDGLKPIPDYFDDLNAMHDAEKALDLEKAAQMAINEALRASDRWPKWPTDPVHALAVLQEEVGELTREVMIAIYEAPKGSADAIHDEAVQVAAMALRFIASLDRYKYEPANNHYQSKL